MEGRSGLSNGLGQLSGCRDRHHADSEFVLDTAVEYFHSGNIKLTTHTPVPPPSLDPQALRLIHHLDVLVHRFLSARFPKGEQVPDISPADFRLLAEVEQAGSLTMTDLAERLDLPLSTATNRVERLVRGNMLARVRSELDRRIVEVSLTEHGKEVVLAGSEVRLSMGRAMLAALSPGEREILIELMQKMSERATT